MSGGVGRGLARWPVLQPFAPLTTTPPVCRASPVLIAGHFPCQAAEKGGSEDGLIIHMLLRRSESAARVPWRHPPSVDVNNPVIIWLFPAHSSRCSPTCRAGDECRTLAALAGSACTQGSSPTLISQLDGSLHHLLRACTYGQSNEGAACSRCQRSERGGAVQQGATTSSIHARSSRPTQQLSQQCA